MNVGSGCQGTAMPTTPRVNLPPHSRLAGGRPSALGGTQSPCLTSEGAGTDTVGPQLRSHGPSQGHVCLGSDGLPPIQSAVIPVVPGCALQGSPRDVGIHLQDPLLPGNGAEPEPRAVVGGSPRLPGLQIPGDPLPLLPTLVQ